MTEKNMLFYSITRITYIEWKRIQRAEFTEEFKSPNDQVTQYITFDVLEEMWS